MKNILISFNILYIYITFSCLKNVPILLSEIIYLLFI